ncbi:hypothetical protein EV127DRAFT_56939 [Xylaria flabelliformis]|nr:hypothetical protein EV127DRAFT_56939 [Xylaria flabelliformis]
MRCRAKSGSHSQTRLVVFCLLPASLLFMSYISGRRTLSTIYALIIMCRSYNAMCTFPVPSIQISYNGTFVTQCIAAG